MGGFYIYCMDLYNRTILPKIGDLIKFSDKWNNIFNDDSITSHGVIFKIQTLKEIQDEYMFDDEWFRSTLCYPLTIDPYESEESIIFYVHWFTDEKYITETYKLINEEWFQQGLFEVIYKDTSY